MSYKIKVKFYKGGSEVIEMTEKEYQEMMEHDQILTYLSERYFNGKLLSNVEHDGFYDKE